ncbi:MULTISPECIES: hypothetical protein [unclassified Paenibacillus]|uniref:hypothetical protein n=1 Tax=unclassified Paenibacillus TaxID=185978 RepID=UPI000955825F|nr:MULTISPECIES: hypothetical protein [unclassified Paenibacillus]QID16137.1 hypothetical protein CIC07_25770 [Paenibacillus sp. RUD330]SIR71914.1 hypothetical protein SAMN05880555_4888 [Paenibacillus sp. RU4X]SIR79296.1 hypothetical protein SAMN05880570_4891 [Paenibacillus sp. RU4T]
MVISIQGESGRSIPLDGIHQRVLELKSDNISSVRKDELFRDLIQAFHPLLLKVARSMFRYDRMIAKELVISRSEHRKLLLRGIQTWTENYAVVVGLLWEYIIKYNPDRGVYFPTYLDKRFDWAVKDAWNKLVRRNTNRTGEKFITALSYEVITDEKEDFDIKKTGIFHFQGVAYNDNFDSLSFEWQFENPLDLVENKDLWDFLKTLTDKQLEAYKYMIMGYMQSQVAGRVKQNSGAKITQQAVAERLEGVDKKIKLWHLKGGDQIEQTKFRKEEAAKEKTESRKGEKAEMALIGTNHGNHPISLSDRAESSDSVS